MTDPNYCEVVVLLDRSASMESLKKEVVGGFLAFAKGQAALPGKCLVSLVQFDSESTDTVFNAKPASEIESFDFTPRGMTPLNDAIARTIDSTGVRLAAMEESSRPGRVIFVIITDGQENSSHEFRLEDVKARIKRQREQWNWEFVYLGANVDAAVEAVSLGIDPNSSSGYVASRAGMANTYQVLNASVLRARSGEPMIVTDAERALLTGRSTNSGSSSTGT